MMGLCALWDIQRDGKVQMCGVRSRQDQEAGEANVHWDGEG